MGFSKENLEKHLNLYKKVQIAENELNYGSALFAKIPISKNNVICTFDGVLVPKAYIKKKMYDSDYIFEYSVDSKFDFDLTGTQSPRPQLVKLSLLTLFILKTYRLIFS